MTKRFKIGLIIIVVLVTGTVVHTAGKGDTLTSGEIRLSSASEKKGHEGMTHSAMTP